MRSVVIVLKFPVEILLAHSEKMVPVANRAAAIAHAEKRGDRGPREARPRKLARLAPERRAAVLSGWKTMAE